MSSRRRREKNLTRYEPPSPSLCSSDEEQDREKYFLENPDFEFDELPQPFRLIDKILEEILDAVNVGIDKVEDLRKRRDEATKVVISNEAAQVNFKNLDKNVETASDDFDVTCEDGMTFQKLLMSVTNTTVYTVCGKELKATNLLTNKVMCNLSLETESSISLLKTAAVKIQQSSELPFSHVDLIFVFNENGQCFIYGCVQKCFVHLQALLDQQHDSSVITDCDFCADGHLAQFVRFIPSSGYKLEIYKIPTENWVLEILEEFKNSNQEVSNTGSTNDSNAENDDSGINAAEAKASVKVSDEKEDNNVPQTSSSFLKQSSTQLVLITTMIQPTEKPCTIGNLHNIMRSIDIGKVGSGDKHPFSAEFFNALREESGIAVDNDSSVANIDTISFESARPNVQFLLGLDSVFSKVPNNDHKLCRHDFVSVWWSTRNAFIIYSLAKSGRDAELLIDAVYLNSDSILSSSVSRDTSLIAIALQNHNVVIWNRITGAPTQVLNLKESIDFCIFTDDVMDSRRSNVLFTASKHGTLKKICCYNESLYEEPVSDSSVVHQSEVLHVSIAPNLGWLVFVARAPNFIIAFDLDMSSAVCHFELPQEYRINRSINECFVIDPNGTKILVHVEKDHGNGELVHGILSFSLCGFYVNVATEDSDIVSSPFLSSGNLKDIAVKLLSNIKHEQNCRRDIQKRRWKEYESELDFLSKKFGACG